MLLMQSFEVCFNCDSPFFFFSLVTPVNMATILTKDLVIMEDDSWQAEFWPVICIFKRSMQSSVINKGDQAFSEESIKLLYNFFWDQEASSLNVCLSVRLPTLQMFHVTYKLTLLEHLVLYTCTPVIPPLPFF